MPRLLISPLAALLALTAVPAPPAAPATSGWGPDWTDGVRMTESVEAALKGAAAKARLGYGYDRNVCVLAGFLAVGADEELTFPWRLEEGEEYAVVGRGDPNTVEIELKVNNPKGKLVGE